MNPGFAILRSLCEPEQLISFSEIYISCLSGEGLSEFKFKWELWHAVYSQMLLSSSPFKQVTAFVLNQCKPRTQEWLDLL